MCAKEYSASQETIEDDLFENDKCKIRNSIINNIINLQLKDLIKDFNNEQEINDGIECINEKINQLNNFINKIAKAKYEYFYKYIDRLSHAKKRKEWNSYDLEQIEKTYYKNLESLIDKRNDIFTLIKEKKFLIEIERVLKLYKIINYEITILYNEIRKDNKKYDSFDFLYNKEETDIDECRKEYIKIIEIDEENFNYFTSDMYFSNFFKYLKKLNNLRKCIHYNNLQNIPIISYEVKKMNYCEMYIINIFINYLYHNFFQDEDYEEKVQVCLKAFILLSIEKQCINKIIQKKINKISSYINNIKKKNENIKENFYFLLENCKNCIDQIYFLNQMFKRQNSYFLHIQKKKKNIYITEKQKERTYDKDYYEHHNINENGNDNEKDIQKNTTNEKPEKKNIYQGNNIYQYNIDIYNDFYIPFVNVLKDIKLNEYIPKDNMLYILNLIEEFLYIIRNKYDINELEKDMLLNLFNKEYEEITFNSINKLANLVELLFEKKNDQNAYMRNDNIYVMDNYDHQSYNFPTLYDIKNYVVTLYKELYTHICYPHIFRKIIVSCNNSLLLLSNNLNNLKQNINLNIDIDMNTKYININYAHKSFQYNLELFLISRKLLRYLFINLNKLKRRINHIKKNTYKNFKVYKNSEHVQENEQLANFVHNKIEQDNETKEDLIVLSFKESFDDVFTFQDHLYNNFTNNILYMENENDEMDNNYDDIDYFLKNDEENKEDKEEVDKKNEGDILQNQINDMEKKYTVKDEEMKLNNFEINYISDIKFNSFNNLNDSYDLYTSDENYEITSFFIKEEINKEKKKKKRFYDLIELEKGICELNHAVNSCIYEYFEYFEKKTYTYLKNNFSNLNINDIYLLFDELCNYFHENIVQHIPYYERIQLVNKLINRILVYLISLSSYYLIHDMDTYIFKYYNSLLKIASVESLSVLNYEYTLCQLYKKAVDIKNKMESYENIPTFFVPIIFVILHGGKNIVNNLNISEEKFINLMVDHLKNPKNSVDKKGGQNQNLVCMLRKYSKSLLL
ncbi:hypothetical protein PFNF135_05095 [Plasmodium falciparum NF135/5.C10]|uniref:Uncharacterized protein n=4 Tax=Plasmodium falciparum TaxID=5833 RepID=A0A024X301_PLAFC|nr:hypothetical protein PFFVO_04523 [Plasmodium falciparum Vietnam Oak-Knoll (FVO)]ETW40793.1 hypothetical protein PFNF135_05095 [Plasmodium falciparum NF135/5.C10]ETW47238.1 hypothetical protein PFMALIP_04762 [Plasmodium falciparum MaliPS096_E11]ETW59196.1 hypothetical protein PFMC_04874 [Plasmodium falciparum CAMP/Malaysia]